MGKNEKALGWGGRSQRALIAVLRNLAFILMEIESYWEILSNGAVLHFRKMPLHHLQQEDQTEQGAQRGNKPT